MSGVGGVFPNYEDHLLDKKKISEYFTGNFHEVLEQWTAMGVRGTREDRRLP